MDGWVDVYRCTDEWMNGWMNYLGLRKWISELSYVFDRLIVVPISWMLPRETTMITNWLWGQTFCLWSLGYIFSKFRSSTTWLPWSGRWTQDSLAYFSLLSFYKFSLITVCQFYSSSTITCLAPIQPFGLSFSMTPLSEFFSTCCVFTPRLQTESGFTVICVYSPFPCST
jgi:hypothetical protein